MSSTFVLLKVLDHRPIRSVAVQMLLAPDPSRLRAKFPQQATNFFGVAMVHVLMWWEFINSWFIGLPDLIIWDYYWPRDRKGWMGAVHHKSLMCRNDQWLVAGYQSTSTDFLSDSVCRIKVAHQYWMPARRFTKSVSSLCALEYNACVFVLPRSHTHSHRESQHLFRFPAWSAFSPI